MADAADTIVDLDAARARTGGRIAPVRAGLRSRPDVHGPGTRRPPGHRVPGRGRSTGVVDAALTDLVRRALAPGWTACGSAVSLREREVGDLVLRRLGARVGPVVDDRPGVVSRRLALAIQIAGNDQAGWRPPPEVCAACERLVDQPRFAGADR
ncbi:MAG: hypothetical protein S0880_20895 [Actinomycetota bacterium]|nr:hypothetical protein [Actinomycetota bacterium]